MTDTREAGDGGEKGGVADERIPITLVSGPLGAGKTTLVNHLLRNAGGRRIAVVLNDMGEVNVDAELVERESEDEGIVDLSNGCICCRLSGDLLDSLDRLARERDFDHLVVEASGISEPLPIARTLSGGDGEGPDPTGRYRLDTLVTVVDCYGFWKEFDAGAALPAGYDPDRPLADVLVEGIEFCDVLLLNKCDLVPDDAMDDIEGVVRRLGPRAAVHRTTESAIDPERVLDTGRFDLGAAQREQGWKRELAGRHDPDGDGVHAGHDHAGRSAAEAHGVESVVYQRDRPFNPVRFAGFLESWDGSVVRAKGFCWLASRPEEVIGLSQAGPSLRAGPIGEWGGDDPATRLVFIGRELDEETLTAGLDDCLVDEGEAWVGEDPFPMETLLR
ncbi:CobW family GTP-binding protein [Halomarina litorea]|uniref:CobW family GTP-binding protein n=1 Tax=Halomarina litorea TaxID=2961595 RepID=UPI0020C23395|nr:GTP-binding protein [Halomarina sp. BCD28]